MVLTTTEEKLMYDRSVSRIRSEFARAVANHRYEISEAGILFPEQKTLLAGVFEDTLNGGDRQISPNIIPTEGLNHALDVILHGVAQVSPWYVALFKGTGTPSSSLTAANFASTLTEVTTQYSEGTRVAYNEAAAAGGVTDNDASRAEFTIAASDTIYGGALLSASTKGSTSGVILCAAKFAAPRAVVSGDTLQVKYTLTLTSS